MPLARLRNLTLGSPRTSWKCFAAGLTETVPERKIDSGSAGNFISQACLDCLRLPRERGSQDLEVQTIQRRPLGKGWVKYCTPVVTLQVGLFHREEIWFLVLECSTVRALSLPASDAGPGGYDWRHPGGGGYDYKSGEHPRGVPGLRSYVFSDQDATCPPHHRPWDCCIDLLHGAKLPKGRVYPLSTPEHRAIEEYVQQALRQGLITHLSSPAASSFFFVGKKDAQIAPLPYPLPLVPAALEDLQHARVFTKLDLRSAYNLIRIRKGDEWKTAFITPSGHYEYRVMLCGISITPAVFQGYEVLRPYHQNREEHLKHVRAVL
ncbi:uncharacterized protein LOC125139889 [Tachysurus fulvidraco]|uniref:uncharacterized protein LOC125139889 n=1 Tax=Tachysurus fulvidraco TaxID=1234273 RepID=UPI001FEFEB31|nr:uncharacterized protein LOC125139889 [Tachysurus fulvidraco]